MSCSLVGAVRGLTTPGLLLFVRDGLTQGFPLHGGSFDGYGIGRGLFQEPPARSGFPIAASSA